MFGIHFDLFISNRLQHTEKNNFGKKLEKKEQQRQYYSENSNRGNQHRDRDASCTIHKQTVQPKKVHRPHKSFGSLSLTHSQTNTIKKWKKKHDTREVEKHSRDATQTQRREPKTPSKRNKEKYGIRYGSSNSLPNQTYQHKSVILTMPLRLCDIGFLLAQEIDMFVIDMMEIFRFYCCCCCCFFILFFPFLWPCYVKHAQPQQLILHSIYCYPFHF